MIELKKEDAVKKLDADSGLIDVLLKQGWSIVEEEKPKAKKKVSKNDDSE